MTAERFTIRAARLSDVPAIAAIYGHAVRYGTASYELEPPSTEEMAVRFEALVGGGYPYLVASEAAGRVAGYAYAGPFRPRPAYRFTVEDSVYVAADCQGHGLGRLLLEALIARCEGRGYRQLVAVIGDGSDRSPSVRLHASLGFRFAGRLEGTGFKHGRWLDTVFMQRALGPGNGRPPDFETSTR